MKILYLSCHSVLEYDEVKLLTEMGHEVKSHGAYRDPRGAYTLPRPGIPGMKFDHRWMHLTAENPKTALTPEMIAPFDVIIIMAGEHEGALVSNWAKIKHKRVIWRSIGQSTQGTETLLKRFKKEGLEIVRYSPKEADITNYVGHDAIIRFYKDPEEFCNWTGGDKRPINFTQTLKGRHKFVHYDEIMGSLVGHPGAKVYGTGNNDLGVFNGGEVTYEAMKGYLRDCAVFVYGGTWPACYTLSFMEAMMTGIPIVALSKKGAEVEGTERYDFYEVEDILKQADVATFNNVEDMRFAIAQYLELPPYAKDVSKRQRETAIKLFGKDTICEQWRQFLESKSC